MRFGRRFYIWLTAVIVCMSVIFLFSSQSGDDSGEISSSILHVFIEFASNSLGLSPSKQVFEFLHLFIRKAAHFCVFFALGFCAAKTLEQITQVRKNVFLFSLGFSSFYAAMDELRQYFIPGRYGIWYDWLLDTAGAFVGIVFVTVLFKRKHKELKGAAK